MKLGAAELRLGASNLFRWWADIMMMAAALAFTIQGTFIAQAATGVNGHYHHGYGQEHAAHQPAKSHAIAHVHADGTVHKHAVDDGARALKDHRQQPDVRVAGTWPSSLRCFRFCPSLSLMRPRTAGS
jgi:hypothetical protein